MAETTSLRPQWAGRQHAHDLRLTPQLVWLKGGGTALFYALHRANTREDLARERAGSVVAVARARPKPMRFGFLP